MDNRETAHKNVLLWKFLKPSYFSGIYAEQASEGKWKVSLTTSSKLTIGASAKHYYAKHYYRLQALDARGKGKWNISLMPSAQKLITKELCIEPYGDTVEEIRWKADFFDWLLSLKFGFAWLGAKYEIDATEQRIIELDLNFTETDAKLEDTLVNILDWHDIQASMLSNGLKCNESQTV